MCSMAFDEIVLIKKLSCHSNTLRLALKLSGPGDRLIKRVKLTFRKLAVIQTEKWYLSPKIRSSFRSSFIKISSNHLHLLHFFIVIQRTYKNMI